MFFIAIAALVALCASFISALFGGGAGLLTVPGFYWMLAHYFPDASNLMQTTITTGCCLSVPLGLVATWRQVAYKNIDNKMLKRSLPPMLVGALCGALLLDYSHSHIIKYAFSVSVFLTAIWMMLYKIDTTKVWAPSRVLHTVLSFLLAMACATLGVSVFFVPFFVRLGLDIRKAIGTSTVIVFLYAVINGIWLIFLGLGASNLPPTNVGYLNLPIFYAGIVPSVIGGLLAVKLVNTIPQHYVKAAFVGLMFVVSVVMAFPR